MTRRPERSRPAGKAARRGLPGRRRLPGKRPPVSRIKRRAAGGYRAGYDRGHDAGFKAGYAKGYEDGLEAVYMEN